MDYVPKARGALGPEESPQLGELDRVRLQLHDIHSIKSVLRCGRSQSQ